MAGMDYPPRNVATPPPLVVDPRKAPPFVDDSTGYKIGAATRTGLGVAAGTAADITQLRSPARMLGGMAMDAVAPPVRDFGKGLLGMTDAPTAAPAAPIAPPTPAPVTAGLPVSAPAAPFTAVDSGRVGGAATPAPAATPAATPSPEVYPTTPPQGISQYLPQLMAAAASRNNAPVVNTTAGATPFTDQPNMHGLSGSWDAFLNDRRDRSIQAKANQTNIEAFNAGTQRRTADVGVLTALAEPIKADAANQTHLATTGMTANTSRATTEATNTTHLKAAEIAGQYAVKRSEAIANARKYAADMGAKGKGSAVHQATTTDGSIVMTQLNDQGEPAVKVIDPKAALAHQQADVAVMKAQHGDEVTIPGGKGIVQIVNGQRKVIDKKTGKDTGWTPPARFSTVGMPPAGGNSGAGQLEDFLLDQ